MDQLSTAAPSDSHAPARVRASKATTPDTDPTSPREEKGKGKGVEREMKRERGLTRP